MCYVIATCPSSFPTVVDIRCGSVLPCHHVGVVWDGLPCVPQLLPQLACGVLPHS
uniref:Uncharacterized protein n=1 Tax=Anguilla anguilla TaxID=7936 RepID=A0A0E9VB02_ANGAN